MTMCEALIRRRKDDVTVCDKEATHGYLCTKHRGSLSSLLIRLPELTQWLAENQAAGGGPAMDRVTGSREDPIPLRPDVLDLIGPHAGAPISQTMTLIGSHFRVRPANQVGEASLDVTISELTEQVAEERAAKAPNPKSDLLTNIRVRCEWLHRQIDWMTTREWIVPTLDHLEQTYRAAERMFPREAEQEKLHEPCPSCDVKALVLVGGFGIKCEKRLAGCGRDWQDEHFERLLVVLGYDNTKWATA